MKYFVESVLTYNTTGKSRKGALLQRVASQFEHQIIGDHQALEALIADIRKLVTACEQTYKGKPLGVFFDKRNCRICVEDLNPRADINTAVFTICYAPVGLTLFSSNVHHAIYSSVASGADSKLLEAYKKGGEK